ncbi:MAG: GNAT family N-acetyltransferase [Ruminococcus bromii]|nr:GNAT family N-acetyltransferase [Ruminococcus bromii]
MNITFERVTEPAQIEMVARIAEPIWHATYDSINGVDSTNYMIEQFQSVPAIHRQLESEGYVYYLMLASGKAAGFIGLVPHKEGKMFLSKLYVADEFRGMGLPHAAFDFIVKLCRAEKLDKIYLTVNKRNRHAIEVYKHFGFYEIDAVVTDIGCGFVMDDYILQKDV